MDKMDKKDAYSPREILLYLLVGGGIMLGISNPALLTPMIFIARYIGNKKVNKKDRARIKSSVYYLMNNKYVTVAKRKGKVKMFLTNKGKENAGIYKIQSMLEMKNRESSKKRWRKDWYLVMFDIEDSKKVKRDALRRVLRRSGFKQMQKSVWVYPHNCIKEIVLVKEYFNIDDNQCRIVVSDSIGDDGDLKKYFKLQ